MKLPYPKQPFLTAYQNKAFPLGVLQANCRGDLVLWAAMKAANCVYDAQSLNVRFNVVMSDLWGVRDGLTVQEDMNPDKADFADNRQAILDILRERLCAGCYVKGAYNERYIHVKDAFGCQDYDHDFLLYGFDAHGFFSAGYVRNGHFQHFFIPFEEFLQALFRTQRPQIPLHCFRVMKDRVPPYHFERFASDLNAYVRAASVEAGRVEGLAALKRLKQDTVAEVAAGRIFMDRRYSKMLEEQKMLLAHAFGALSRLDDAFQPYAERSDTVLQRARLIHALGLKMTFAQNASLMDSIAALFDAIIAEESAYLPGACVLLADRLPRL